ncbi:unnamed protein product [Zymoseptoria tritici ST99CH_1A5]|uniref:Obg-like ATPase 1 n=2 Tax=Zymoseptoria tritici TaxID=1047171 RepID=A0A1X7RGG2_ZYMT9|nr:unnamed protein product [Zymoseptoria tritici ST99CH_3D7]SMR45035.1 unnamed protein product [Zymoseptoria tritici ST99CH_3D1]SMY20200.1 unnamed protein product [Zymoseptoria tritici ST99CH_1A5]
MQAEIRTQLPDVDSVVVDYAAGYLNHAARQFSADGDPLAEAAAAIAQLLLSASGDLSRENEATVQKLVEKFVQRLSTQSNVDGRQQAPSARKLDQTISVASQRNISSTLGLTGGAVDLESANTRKVESRVDKKKLEKAERKLRAKLDKKEFKTVEYEASRLLDQPDEQMSYEEFFMAVNPLQLGSDAASKSKDIKVDGIDISIGGKRILTDTNLTLAYGRRYGLVGQNGIGKSTLLRALAKREVSIPTHISILHVEQEISGDDTPALQAVLDADVWRKHLLKEQEKITKELAELEAERASMADTSTDAARLDKQREGLDITLSDVQGKLAEMESDKAESRAASILAGLGFSHERQQFATKTFSGGWRMRLALARALFCEPDLLLLDEPSNMLDVPSITFLANYLQGYPSTVLVVSHDRAFLNEVATDIIHQHSERLDYYKGANFESFYATKEERRKTAKREYENQMAVRAHLQAFIDKFRYNAAKSSEAQSRIKKLEKMPMLEAPESEYEVHFKFPEVEKLSPPIIQMDNVSFGYTPDKILLKNVDLDVQLDSRIGIVGPNGAGKTTALKLLIGALSPSSGLISQNPRLRIGFFAQHHVDALDLNASAVGFMAAKYPGKSDEEYRRHLGAFGITGMTGLQKMELLSGGQKSRVAFACIGLQNPHILVLDEPSNHLDIEAMDALSVALNQFQGGVLMVSHDVTMLQKVCTSLWVCDQGTVEHFPGTVKDYKKRITEQANDSGVASKWGQLGLFKIDKEKSLHQIHHTPRNHQTFLATGTGPGPAFTSRSTFRIVGVFLPTPLRTYASKKRMPPKKEVKQEKLLLGRPGNSLKSGIVGLANVGKSTFFQALTKCSLGNPANFPYATIDPEEARVIVPDERFDWLVDHYKPKSIVPANLTVYDIAGLTRGASTGAGLGNAFLSHIRAVDAVFQVVRCFDDAEIIHVEGDVDPIRDLEIISEELRIKDTEFVEKALENLAKQTRRGGQSLEMKKLKEEQATVEKILEMLKAGKDVRKGDWGPKEVEVINPLFLLSAKPVVFLVNLSEKDYIRQKNKHLPKIAEWVKEHATGDPIIPISVSFEDRLTRFETEADAEEECKKLGTKSALPKIVTTMRKALNLGSFFTTGTDEVRQWTIRNGTKAPQAAGVIHGDFEKTFIQAVVYNYKIMKEEGDEAAVKAKGKVMTKGKDYVVEDGDILLIKAGAAKA